MSAPTFDRPLSTFDTVITETPAARATSLIVTIRLLSTTAHSASPDTASRTRHRRRSRNGDDRRAAT
ncbi:hypothetical protein GCM10027059_31160 [Myceligenerans halotolerans]